jgi:hypothetical protein
MRVCILCEDKFVTEARESAKTILPNHKVLSIPVSPNGILPATHWFCVCNVNEDNYKKLLGLQKNSKISVCLPKVFLEEFKLKLIDTK